MPLQVPNPAEVGGAWGAGIFPPWFTEQAQAAGWDYMTALNQFSDWVGTGPVGPDNQPIDFGWYWNVFRPGGQFHGQPFEQNAQNYTYPGQSVENQTPPPPGPTQPPPSPPPPSQPPSPPGQGQQPGQLPPRPTDPPPGRAPGSGQWRPRVNPQTGERTWQWVPNPGQQPQTPPAQTPPAETPPAETPPAQTPPAGSGPPVVSYPSQPPANPAPAQSPAPQQQQAQAQAPQQQQGAQAQAPQYPVGGGLRAPNAPPPMQTGPTNRQPQTQGGGGGGGGAPKPPSTPPQTPSVMNAQRWGKPGGLLG